MNKVAQGMWTDYLLDTLDGVLTDNDCNNITFNRPIENYTTLDSLTRYHQDDFINPYLKFIPEAIK